MPTASGAFAAVSASVGYDGAVIGAIGAGGLGATGVGGAGGAGGVGAAGAEPPPPPPPHAINAAASVASKPTRNNLGGMATFSLLGATIRARPATVQRRAYVTSRRRGNASALDNV